MIKYIIYRFLTKKVVSLYSEAQLLWGYPPGTLGYETMMFNIKLAKLYLDIADILYNKRAIKDDN